VQSVIAMGDGVVHGYGGLETLGERLWQYHWAVQTMSALGLTNNDLIVDVGAGMCDLDYVLRQRGWFGRYLPVDASIDPAIDLDVWFPTFEADFYVCIDTVEHVHDWRRLVLHLMGHARKGVLVTTADAETIDVLGMHPSHVSALTMDDLCSTGLVVTNKPVLTHYRQLCGFWKPGWDVLDVLDKRQPQASYW
jgi:hypothetical protein